MYDKKGVQLLTMTKRSDDVLSENVCKEEIGMSDFPASTTVTSPAAHPTSEKVNESESKIHSQYYHRLVPFMCHFFYKILNLENVHQKVGQLKFTTIQRELTVN